MANTIHTLIAQADTPAKVWELVSLLLDDGNGYPDEVYMLNARHYAKIATEPTAKITTGEIPSEFYAGLYGTGKLALYIIAKREGCIISQDTRKTLNVAGVRNVIARHRQNVAI